MSHSYTHHRQILNDLLIGHIHFSYVVPDQFHDEYPLILNHELAEFLINFQTMFEILCIHSSQLRDHRT